MTLPDSQAHAPALQQTTAPPQPRSVERAPLTPRAKKPHLLALAAGSVGLSAQPHRTDAHGSHLKPNPNPKQEVGADHPAPPRHRQVPAAGFASCPLNSAHFNFCPAPLPNHSAPRRCKGTGAGCYVQIFPPPTVEGNGKPDHPTPEAWESRAGKPKRHGPQSLNRLAPGLCGSPVLGYVSRNGPGIAAAPGVRWAPPVGPPKKWPGPLSR